MEIGVGAALDRSVRHRPRWGVGGRVCSLPVRFAVADTTRRVVQPDCQGAAHRLAWNGWHGTGGVNWMSRFATAR